MSSQFTAVLDACVLHPMPLANILLHLAEAELYRAKWTNEIHEEWIKSVLAVRRDLTREQLEHRREAMNSSIPDCLVEGYERLIPSLDLPDKNDRHVLAAAIRARAALIVTFNLKDFPDEKLAEFDVAAIHPDTFLSDLIDLHPAIITARVQMALNQFKNPPINLADLTSKLEQLGLPGAAAGLRALFPEGTAKPPPSP